MNELAGKKILYVITKSNWGGAQAYVYMLASHFSAAGAEVVVALGGTGEADASAGLLAQKLLDAGIRTIFVKNFMRDISFFREFKALGELRTIFENEKPDVIHLNSSKAGGIGALAARLADVSTVIFTSHGLAFDEDKNVFTKLFRRIATWATFTLAHHVILISKNTYERARRFPLCKHKMHLIYNGLAPLSLESRKSARAKLLPHAKRGTVWIGTVSELTHNKGLSYLIDALALLKTRGHAFEVGIIGIGEERETLFQQIFHNNLRERVHLLGFVDQAARYLTAFDIFTLTSLKEGHPYVLLEAARARCAVVGSRIPGITDIVDTSTGMLVEAKDTRAIAGVLETLLFDEKRRRELGSNLYTSVTKKFSIEHMLTATAGLY